MTWWHKSLLINRHGIDLVAPENLLPVQEGLQSIFHQHSCNKTYNLPFSFSTIMGGVMVIDDLAKLAKDLANNILQLGQPILLHLGHVVHNDDRINSICLTGLLLQQISDQLYNADY